MKRLMQFLMLLALILLPIAMLGQSYDFSTAPYIHTQSLSACQTYSGNSCIKPQQWGFIDIDPIAKTYQMRSGVGKQSQGFQPPKIAIVGDCWQSGSKAAASAGVRKWVVVIGTPPMCAASGQPSPALAVQVWKFEFQNWVWKGQVGAIAPYPPTPTGNVGIEGDTGYVREGNPQNAPPFTWSSIDLATLTITQTGIPEASLPPLEDQQGIAGVNYELTKIGNPATYRLAAIGPAPPTNTPGGPTSTATKTATKTPTSGTPSKTPTIDPCGPVPNCKTNTPSPWKTATHVPTIPPSASPTPATGCGAPSPTSLCLASRFRVAATWTKPDGSSGSATAIPRTTDTGEFWFFSATNIEMVVKVLNGCGIGGHWWVFAGGLTNVKVDWTVTDTTTGAAKVYANPQGVAFQPVQDTGAFPCP